MTERRMIDILSSMPPELSEAVISRKVKGNEIWMEIPSSLLPPVASHIKNLWGAHLVTFHAVDNRALTGDFKLIVLMALSGEDDFVVLLTSVDPAFPQYPSLTPQIPCAEWYEREIMDLMGLRASGHPELKPLVLWDDWPEGIYPLRKDFDPAQIIPQEPHAYPYRRVEGSGVFEIPVGPVHAGVIEPGHFRFSVAGEPILNLEVRLGYVHRGVEKLSESTPYAKGVMLAERISGDNGFAHSLAYCQAVESLGGAQVPERALYLRTAYAELERIYNLLGDIGGIALDVAFNVAAQHAYILRERCMELNDFITGNRFLRGVNRLGGVWIDIPSDKISKILAQLVRFKLDIKEFSSLMLRSQSVLDRLETTGRIPLEVAKELELVGPVARASGLDRDVRRDHPYAAYRHLSFRVPLRREGDVNARLCVKLEELQESISLVEQALGSLPSGEITCSSFEVPEGRTAMSLVESPRGELVHWLISGKGGRPFRHKVRDASFHNWRAIEVAVQGEIVPDFPLINKSLNLSYAGNDL
ncbi:MAG: NADH-quinone oxidoreductase subunit C [Methanomassiliicoccales archaeon]